MAIINGTFSTDLSGWTYSSAVTWQSPGVAQIYAFGYGCPADWIQQTFTITAPTISFDYNGKPSGPYGIVQVGWDFIVGSSTIISSEWLPGIGTRTLDVSSYIGKSATIRFKFIPYGGVSCENDWVRLTIDNVANAGGTPVGFSTFPTGATIIINGTEIVPKTNVQINYLPGIYSYILRLPCYEDLTGQINVIGPPISVTGSFVLNTGSLSITSQPPGAAVYYGPALQGTTPLSYPSCYPEGIYNYTIFLLGYQSFSGGATVTRGLLTEVNAPLIAVGPAGQGSLYISSTPPGASIYIDGILQIGVTTPTAITGLTVGSHTVSLKLNGYYSEQFPVTITENVTTNISSILTPSGQTPSIGEGCISFGGTPLGAHIILDGTDTGQITPAIICGLSLGLHTYELSLTGYQTITGSTTLVTGIGNNILANLIPSAPSICSWITSKGGPNSITIPNIFELVDAYIGIGNVGFMPTITEILGVVDYYLGFTASGNTKTGCSFI